MHNASQETQYEVNCIEALELRLTGMTYQQIADEQGVNQTTAMRRVSSAIDAARPHADYDQYRARQMVELEAIRTRLYNTVVADDTAIDDRHSAVDRLLKVHDRESKLLALDKAPTPIEEAARKMANASSEEIADELVKREKAMSVNA